MGPFSRDEFDREVRERAAYHARRDAEQRAEEERREARRARMPRFLRWIY
jgi:hypothetical protein